MSVSARQLIGSIQTRLSEEQCVKLHNACLRILEQTGVILHDEEAITLICKAGAKLGEDSHVRIPSQLVEDAIVVAPKNATLYDQSGAPAMPIEDGRSYFGPGSDCLNILDHQDKKRRLAVLQDVINGVLVCDSLEHIDFLMSMFIPSDVHADTANIYQMEAMLTYSNKPIVFVAYDIESCKDVVSMAEVVGGGHSKLTNKPFVASYINATSGLNHNKEALQKLLFLADQGIPAFYIPGAMAGTAAPVTVAGSTVIRMAGGLVGLVLAQLKREGSTVFIPGWAGLPMDMRTTVQSYFGPEHLGVTQALSHYYGLPMFAMGGASDANTVDQQAAIESSLMLMYEALVGSHIVHNLGFIESGLSGSLVQLVICNEVLDWVKRALSPVDITDETLALDVINHVGPSGHYLETEHTLENYRQHWYSNLFNRERYEKWIEGGGTTLAERAAARVDEILTSHKPKSLSLGTRKSLRSIIEGTKK